MQIELDVRYSTRFGEYISLEIGGTSRPMQWAGDGMWHIEIRLPAGDYEYGYALRRDGALLRSEECPHLLTVDRPEGVIRRRDWWQDRPKAYYDAVKSPTGPYGSRAAGVAVPVFSLRSGNSFGTGEFNDLKLLVDWAVKSGLRCIQLLPVNDTLRTFQATESYPYNASSSFALHPQFINLEDAGVKVDAAFKKLRKELNDKNFVDFDAVNKAKDKLLRKAFAEKFEADSGRSDYRAFVKENEKWLFPYACFRALCAGKKTADFSKWGRMAVYSEDKTRKWYASHSAEVDYFIWLQYHLMKQLLDVADYARSRKVFLKGDLPIGVGRFSADTWQHPELFNMDSSAGAPPDFFSRDGQNWGFPTYNWDAMAKDGYRWWKRRLGKMSCFFDAYRIDHILGFFRIWEIPYAWGDKCGVDVSGMFGHFNPAMPYSEGEILCFDSDSSGNHPLFLEDPRHPGGWNPRINAFDLDEYRNLPEYKKKAFESLYTDYFYHRHEGLWAELGRKKLGALMSHSLMLACGEDLGMIAHCVPVVMDENNILSLEMPRMPKVLGQEFGNPSDYPYMSVCTTSTHDMSPMRLWWTTAGEQARHYYYNVLGLCGEAPSDPDAAVCRAIVANVMKAGSMLCIVPLQDYLACSDAFRVDASDLAGEQINDPADAHRVWSYRMHVNIEKMIDDDGFCGTIETMVKNSLR